MSAWPGGGRAEWGAGIMSVGTSRRTAAHRSPRPPGDVTLALRLGCARALAGCENGYGVTFLAYAVWGRTLL